MISSTGRERILLLLQNFSDIEKRKEVPYHTSQAGISEGVDLSQTRVSRLMKDMIEDDQIKELKKHVKGLKRRRKVYGLTHQGERKAGDIREKLMDEKVSIRTSSGKKEIRLEEIDSYIDSRYPTVEALVRLEERDIIDTSEEKKKREDVFVGRKEELGELISSIENVEEIGCSVVFIQGEAGIGKTRLVSEFKMHAAERGFNFLVGNSYYESSDPYLPLKEAFQEYMDRSFEGYDEGLVSSLVDLTREGPRPEDRKMFDAQRKSAFYESTQEVKKIAEKNPLVIFLDDLQWADRASLEIFHYMIQHLKDAPVLFIGAFRPEEIGREHPLSEVLQRISYSERERSKKIELDRLGEGETREIIEGLVDSEDVSEGFVDLLHSRSEGNPLFIKECVGEMQENGSLDPVEGRYPSSEDDFSIPSLIKDIISRRVDRLDRETRKILQVGSVIGEKVPFPILLETSGMDELDMLDHIDILQESRLWIEDPDEERLDFTHELVRNSVYQDIPEPVKLSLHEKVAGKIESIYEERLNEFYSDLGYHYKKADISMSSFKYYLKAAEEAENVYAHENAIDFYDEALDIAPDEEDRLNALEGLSDVNRVLGEYETARGYLEEGLEITESIETKQRLYRKLGKTWERQSQYDKGLEMIERGLNLSNKRNLERSRLLSNRGWMMMRMREYEEAVEAIEEGKDIAEDLNDKRQIAQCLHHLGSVLFYEAKFDKALDNLSRSLELREETEEERERAATLNNIGAIYGQLNELGKALEHHEKALEIRKRIGDKSGISGSLNNLGVIHFNRSEYEQAIDYFEESLELTRRIGDRSGVAFALNNIGMVSLERGEPEEAAKRFKKSIEVCDEIDDKLTKAGSLNNLGLYHHSMGELDQALDLLKDSLGIREKVGDQSGKASSLANIGDALYEKQKYDESEKNYEKSLKICRELGDMEQLVNGLQGLAKVKAKNDENEKALEIIEEAIETSGKLDSPEKEKTSYLVRSLINRKKGDLEKAKEDIEKTKASVSKDDRDVWGKIRFHEGLVLKELGSKMEAKERLKEAVDLFQKRGMKLWADKTKEELDSLG